MRVRINGTITSDNLAALYRWYGFNGVCCPNDVRNAIAVTPKDEELIFEINSGGGSVYAGFEMYTLARQAERETICEIQSIAASAASVFAMGCTTRRISPVANMMIHRASGGAEGNSETMRQAKQMLDTIDESIVVAYEERCGEKCTKETLRAMMEEERFFTAQECIQYGLADEIVEGKNAVPMGAVALAAGINDALPDIEWLIQRNAGTNTNKGEDQQMTVEELRQSAPELVAQIAAEGAQAERERIAAIEGQALPGYEDIVQQAKADSRMTAADVAMAIIARQKKTGADYLANRKKDAENGGVNEVTASAKEAEDENKELNDALDEAFGKEA